MPFTTPAGMTDYLAGGSVRLDKALRVVRTDGTVFAYTSEHSDRTLPALTVGGITVPSTLYHAGEGTFPANLVQSDDPGSVDNWEFKTFYGRTPQADVEKGLFGNAAWTLLFYARDHPTYQILRARGTVGEVQARRVDATWKMQGLSSKLQQQVLEVTSPLNRYRWGDAEMVAALAAAGLSLSGSTADGFAFRVAGHPSTITDARRSFKLTGIIGQPAGRFNDGVIKWTSGANNGLSYQIMSADTTTGIITLWERALYDVATGDNVQATIAEPLRIEDWILVFGDATHFGGEPQITTVEEAADVTR